MWDIQLENFCTSFLNLSFPAVEASDLRVLLNNDRIGIAEVDSRLP